MCEVYLEVHQKILSPNLNEYVLETIHCTQSNLEIEDIEKNPQTLRSLL